MLTVHPLEESFDSKNMLQILRVKPLRLLLGQVFCSYAILIIQKVMELYKNILAEISKV